MARLCVGTDIEADQHRAGCLGKRHVGFVYRADTGMQHTDRDFVCAEIMCTLDDRLDGTLYVPFDDNRDLFDLAGLNAIEDLVQRAAGTGLNLGVAIAALTEFRNFARPRLALDNP